MFLDVFRDNSVDRLARSFFPQHMLAEMTSKCNLRCKYCQKSLSEWNSTPGRDDEMPADVEAKIFSSLALVPFKTVQLSGIGEFTFRKDWVEILNRFLSHGIAVTMISNFARNFSDAELDALLKLNHLMVSIDTVDSELLKSIRRSVSLSTIATNLLRLRMRAEKLNKPLPYLKLNAVLYEENMLGVEDLSIFAIKNEVNEMQYERMYVLTDMRPPTDLALSGPERARDCLSQCKEAEARLNKAGIKPSFHGDLFQLLADRANA